MSDLPNKQDDSKELTPKSKVTGSLIYRNVSPEDRKKLEQIAKEKAQKMGLFLNIIEK